MVQDPRQADGGGAPGRRRATRYGARQMAEVVVVHPINPAQQRLTTVKQDFARLMLGSFAASFPSYPLTFKYAGIGEAPEGKADVLEVTGPANFSARLVVQQDTHLPVMLMWQQPAPVSQLRSNTRHVLRRFPRRQRTEMALSDQAGGWWSDDRRDDVRSDSHQREDRREEIRGAQMTGRCVVALKKLVCILAVLAIGAATAAPAFAQSGNATLRVTVVDPSGGVIVGATVTVAGVEPATRSVQVAPVQTAASGVATIAGLVPGRYAIDAVFPGFQKRTLPDVRVRNGENRQSAMLDIERVEASVTVEQDSRRRPPIGRPCIWRRAHPRSDRRTLRRSVDLPAAASGYGRSGRGHPHRWLRRQRAAGQGADPIDSHLARSVCGGISQRRRRLDRDHHAAGPRPDSLLLAVPGRDDGLSGRSPFVPVRGPEQNLNYGFGLGGTLVKDKSSFNLNVFGINAYDTPNLNAALPTGTLSRALNVKSPRDNLFTSTASWIMR